MEGDNVEKALAKAVETVTKEIKAKEITSQDKLLIEAYNKVGEATMQKIYAYTGSKAYYLLNDQWKACVVDASRKENPAQYVGDFLSGQRDFAATYKPTPVKEQKVVQKTYAEICNEVAKASKKEQKPAPTPKYETEELTKAWKAQYPESTVPEWVVKSYNVNPLITKLLIQHKLISKTMANIMAIKKYVELTNLSEFMDLAYNVVYDGSWERELQTMFKEDRMTGQIKTFIKSKAGLSVDSAEKLFKVLNDPDYIKVSPKPAKAGSKPEGDNKGSNKSGPGGSKRQQKKAAKAAKSDANNAQKPAKTNGGAKKPERQGDNKPGKKGDKAKRGDNPGRRPRSEGQKQAQKAASTDNSAYDAKGPRRVTVAGENHTVAELQRRIKSAADTEKDTIVLNGQSFTRSYLSKQLSNTKITEINSKFRAGGKKGSDGKSVSKKPQKGNAGQKPAPSKKH
jgi:hypothetical protein